MRTTDPKVHALEGIEVLAAITPRQLRSFARLTDHIDVQAGQVLIHQHQLNRHAYLVERGTLAIEVDGVNVATVAAGSIVGERSAIERGTANATVRVLHDATVFAVDHRVLLAIAGSSEEFSDLLHRLAAERTNVAA